jgi:hypothetical protein
MQMCVIIIVIIILSLSQDIIVNSVQEVGGLRIVRAPSSRTPSDPHLQSSTTIPTNPKLSSPTANEEIPRVPSPSTVAKPPSKGKTTAKDKKEPTVLSATHEEQEQDQDPELDKDVRVMNPKSIPCKLVPLPIPIPTPRSTSTSPPQDPPHAQIRVQNPHHHHRQNQSKLKNPIKDTNQLIDGHRRWNGINGCVGVHWAVLVLRHGLGRMGKIMQVQARKGM